MSVYYHYLSRFSKQLLDANSHNMSAAKQKEEMQGVNILNDESTASPDDNYNDRENENEALNEIYQTIEKDTRLQHMVYLYLTETLATLLAREKLVNYAGCGSWNHFSDSCYERVPTTDTTNSSTTYKDDNSDIKIVFSQQVSIYLNNSNTPNATITDEQQRVLVLQSLPPSPSSQDPHSFSVTRNLYIAHRNITDSEIIKLGRNDEYSFSEVSIRCVCDDIHRLHLLLKQRVILHDILLANKYNTPISLPPVTDTDDHTNTMTSATTTLTCSLDRDHIVDYLELIAVSDMALSSISRRLMYRYNDVDYSARSSSDNGNNNINLQLDTNICHCSVSTEDEEDESGLHGQSLPPCQRVMLMGLGGGKLLGFLLKYHPCVIIDTVEKYPQVVNAAKHSYELDEIVCSYLDFDENTANTQFYPRFRALNMTSCRSRVIIGDALQFIKTYHADTQLDYDFISMDIFEGIDNLWMASDNRNNTDDHNNSTATTTEEMELAPLSQLSSNFRGLISDDNDDDDE